MGNRIFICGHRKSGTTLMNCLLDNHPDLFVYPYETHFWYSFYPEYINKSEKEKKLRIKNYIYKDLVKTLDEWVNIKIDSNRLYKTFCYLLDKTEKQTIDYFNTIIKSVQKYFNQENKIIVTKDTHLEIYADKIHKYYPDSYFINLIRDPRDNCASLLRGWDKHYKYQYDSKERLFRDFIDRAYLCMKMALVNYPRYYRYAIVKYEDLVIDTEIVMDEIKDFLNIEHNSSLYKPTIIGKQWKGNSFDKKHDKINDSRVGIYKKYLTGNQIKVIEFYFRDLLIDLSYTFDYEYDETIEAIEKHYEWFNHNQIYSGKNFRRYE